MSDISEITIGYSKTGVATYADDVIGDVQKKVIETVIVGELSGLQDSIDKGWKGIAAVNFNKKLSESTTSLQSVLLKMHDAFKDMMSVQADTYRQQDEDMAEQMEAIDFLGKGEA